MALKIKQWFDGNQLISTYKKVISEAEKENRKKRLWDYKEWQNLAENRA